jgi:hypothetical protein
MYAIAQEASARLADPAESGASEGDYALRRARDAQRFSGLLALAIGAATIAAWLSGAKDNSLAGFLTVMRLNAAFGFAVAGASLVADTFGSARVRGIRLAGGGIIALIGGLTLLEYAGGRDFGIDNLLVTDWRIGIFPAGRMSPQTALILALIGLALMILNDSRRRATITKGIAVAIAATAILALAGHTMGAGPRGAVWGPLGTMPVHGAVAALSCSLGLLAARPTPGLGDILFSPTLTSAIARRWLVGALLMPLVVSAAASGLLRIGVSDHTALATLTIATIAILTATGVVAEAAVSQRLERRQLELEQRNTAMIAELETALAEVRTLRGLLPICSHCKRIRDNGKWEAVDMYIAHRSDAEFSHGVCPDCMEKHYPGL